MHDVILVSVAITGCIATYASLFMFCLSGNVLTNKLGNLALVAYNMNWVDMPIKYQWYMMMILKRAQKEFLLSGAGLVQCTLYNFARVTCH